MIDIPETILEPLYDLEQYAMLMRCSRNKDLAEWNEWRKANPEEEIMLQGADFIGKYCKGADFRGGLCNGAIFSLAHCEGADFRGANC